MLQQTQVKTVIPYFKNFINKIPNLKKLANVYETRLMKCWEGLGFYSRARNLKKTAKKITIFIRTSPFQMGNNYYANSKDIDLPIRTNDSIILIKQALSALKNIYKRGYRYQKVGIVLSGLKDADIYNKNLFSIINNDEKRIKLMQAIDHTNIKYGRNALSIAQARLKKKWNIKRQYSSKIDTACFDFLPIVKIA